MTSSQVRFTVTSHAAWAPGLTTPADWQAWSEQPFTIDGAGEPGVPDMPAMLRRRAGFLGKMALEVAYRCMADRQNVPTVFCSRHGDVERSLALLSSVTAGEPVSPTGFGLSVHNAAAGLFSIARNDRANHLAVASGASTVEHSVIEACGLLADGADEVLLVNYDAALPALFAGQQDCHEQPYAWAWLMTRPDDSQPAFQLDWSIAQDGIRAARDPARMPDGLAVWQFFLDQAALLERRVDAGVWRWSRRG